MDNVKAMLGIISRERIGLETKAHLITRDQISRNGRILSSVHIVTSVGDTNLKIMVKLIKVATTMESLVIMLEIVSNRRKMSKIKETQECSY